MSVKEIIIPIQILSTKKTLGWDSITGKFYQLFKKQIIPVQYKLFQKTEEKEPLPISFYEVSITLTTKPDKDIITTGQDPLLTYSKQNYSKLSSTLLKTIHHNQMGFIQERRVGLTKFNKCNLPY